MVSGSPNRVGENSIPGIAQVEQEARRVAELERVYDVNLHPTARQLAEQVDGCHLDCPLVIGDESAILVEVNMDLEARNRGVSITAGIAG